MARPCISMNESSNSKSIKSAMKVGVWVFVCLFLFGFGVFFMSNMNFFLVKLGRKTAGFLIDVLYYFDNLPTAIGTNIIL